MIDMAWNQVVEYLQDMAREWGGIEVEVSDSEVLVKTSEDSEESGEFVMRWK